MNRDNTEKILSFSLFAIILSGIILLTVCKFACRVKTISTIVKADQLFITNGPTQTYAGGIISILYIVTVCTMIGGVVMKYLYFNQRVENSYISAFDFVNEV